MPKCIFTSDLHGRPERYKSLWRLIAAEKPDAVFCGGDLLPMRLLQGDFLDEVMLPGFVELRGEMGHDYPRVFVIMGNDDPRIREDEFIQGEKDGLWEYIHGRRSRLDDYDVYGYACVPPTPFQLKDWERYDVSRFVDPGCISPEEGRRSVEVDPGHIRYGTIAEDLEQLAGDDDLSRAIFLFHSPPYGGRLDHADLAGKTVDHVPLDEHVGSIAIGRFIEKRQPMLTLHGHVHESAGITGDWREQRGATESFGAAHDGPELALVRFDTERLVEATRDLID